MNGAVYTTSAKQRGVGSIDDGVHLLGGDVTLDYLNFRCHDGHVRSRPKRGRALLTVSSVCTNVLAFAALPEEEDFPDHALH
ncbi:hypothetical protein GCM10027404_30240 [Arthrobacter tumbae]